MRLFADVASLVEDEFLARALALASRGRGATAPNPVVGCVVVADGRIAGEGFHARAGGAHAEVIALADAGERAAGADLYVTLEPCAHHGRTPPCTEAIISAGVARVFAGMRDPNALAGGGAEELRAAGITVSFAPDPRPFAELNAGWLKRLATGMPRVTVKVALSLDGRVAFERGRRASITGQSGAVVTRRVRGVSDAILVGAATVDADDPALTVRDARDEARDTQPLRVVLARTRLPRSGARVLSDGAAPTLVLASSELAANAPGHWDVAEYRAEDGLAGAFRVLGSRGVSEVLVEPGPRLFASLVSGGLIDALVTVTAGGVAGDDAVPLYRGKPVRAGTALSHLFEPVETGIVGDVVATVWEPSERAGALEAGR